MGTGQDGGGQLAYNISTFSCCLAELKRSLDLFKITLMGVGAILAAGIYMFGGQGGSVEWQRRLAIIPINRVACRVTFALWHG